VKGELTMAGRLRSLTRGIALGLLGVGALSTEARAAGFDTPILYTARHQAMGGTAIGYVNDPSAGFHNPAGLQGVQGLAFIGDFSLILGKVRGSPEQNRNLNSQTVVAPFFLVGGAYRVHEWVTLGLAAFPVASGGAEYEYRVGTQNWVDRTEIVFLEATPMLSINVPKDRWLPGKLAFGAGYRLSYMTFDRQRGERDRWQYLDLGMTGTNFGGFRVGLQYAPIDALKLGVVFRNKVVVNTKADTATVLTSQATDASLEFTLPAKLGVGGRFDAGPVGVASDLEYAFQSQNKRPALKGTLMGSAAEVPNVFDWHDGFTWRSGFEFRLGKVPGRDDAASQGVGPMRRAMVPLRVGYIYDTRVTNPQYPSAFGTPPGPTHTFTAGLGFVQERWQINAAFTRRMGKATVDETDTSCVFCGYPGKYKITMTGFYIDASVDLPM
jgi:long-subunit fatty acid transport protein